MLALEASSHPVTYIRALGTSSGLLYPPDKLHPNKRFVVSQDILEMLLRSCVNTGEVISGMEIREEGNSQRFAVRDSSGIVLCVKEKE